MRHYGLFGRLALETRQQILTEAFGHRTLHMYLYNSGPPGHPLYPPVLPLTSQQQSRRWKDRADGLLRRILGKGSEQQQNTTGYCEHCRCGPGPSSPRYPGCMRLKWASCVCHRGEGRGEGVVEDGDPRWYMILMQNGLLSAIQTPDMDNCFSHPSSRRVHEGGWQKFVCQEWSEELREVECQVGVLGWLLTCRQAYVDFIFGSSTNTWAKFSIFLPLLCMQLSCDKIAKIFRWHRAPILQQQIPLETTPSASEPSATCPRSAAGQYSKARAAVGYTAKRP